MIAGVAKYPAILVGVNTVHRLLGFDRIGLDFDGTLVDGPASSAIQDFVRSHPEKTFSIVTHRTRAQAATIPEELAAVGLDRGQFATVLPIADRLAVLFEMDQEERRRHGWQPLGRIPFDALGEGEKQYVLWKGYACRRLGAQALVDDIPEQSRIGCDKYGIALIDARTVEAAQSVVTETRRPGRILAALLD